MRFVFSMSVLRVWCIYLRGSNDLFYDIVNSKRLEFLEIVLMVDGSYKGLLKKICKWGRIVSVLRVEVLSLFFR